MASKDTGTRTPPQGVEFSTFVKGLITEASPLTFPDNASLDENNFILEYDGSRRRRLGMGYENSYTLKGTGVDIINNSYAPLALHTYLWKDVRGASDISILVVQVGSTLYFYEANADTISDHILNSGTGVVIASPAVSVQERMSFSNILGRLIVTHRDRKVYVLEYDAMADTITTINNGSLKVRDVWGVDDGLEVTTRQIKPFDPGDVTMSPYIYNMWNEGWPPDDARTKIFGKYPDGGDNFTCFGGVAGYSDNLVVRSPIHDFWMNRQAWPAHSDIFSSFIAESAENAAGIGAFNSYIHPSNRRGTKEIITSTKPPKGKFIIDVFSRTTSRATEAQNWAVNSDYIMSGNLPLDSSDGYISDVATFGGRAWYSVKETKGYSSGNGEGVSLNELVFYSQVGDTPNTLTKCYSHNDPTAVDISDPLDTDGGFVSVRGAGEVIRLLPLGASLFVFCTNGVWEVHGGENAFTPTNQTVSQVSTVGVLSKSSIVPVEDTVVYWSNGGIYRLGKDQITGRGIAEDISKASIQSFYTAIPNDCKRHAVGVYDGVASQIRWLYANADSAHPHLYTNELVFDTNLGAFYKLTIGELATKSPHVFGYVPPAGLVFTTEIIALTSVGTGITVGGVPVGATVRSVDTSIASSIKYATIRKNSSDANYSVTFSMYNEPNFKDWVISGTGDVGVDAPAYLLTGYITGGSSQLNKQVNYLTVHCRRTEAGFVDDGSGNLTPLDPSSCKVQAQWEWTNHVDGGRWGAQFQAYRLPRVYVPVDDSDDLSTYGFTVVTTKNKLRGKGRALSLRFDTEPGKNLHIYGWAATFTVGMIV